MMDVGKRSLMNSQTALQTVSHNIANKSTEGYSRQRVDIQSNVPIGEGQLRIGMGARPGTVSRVNNGFIEKQLEREQNSLGQMSARSEMLTRVEQVYNEQVNKGLNQYMGEFFNAFRELASNPESLASRTLVKEMAENLTKDFGRVHHQLTEIQKDADFRIATAVEEINQTTREIATINEKIMAVELNGATANDERDRRDHLLKKLGEKINIRYTEGEKGQMTVMAGNNALLVSGFSQRDLFVAPTPAREGKAEGNLDIFYRATEHGSPINVTKQLTGGMIGGLLDVRDGVTNRLKDETDQLAYRVSLEVNRAHSMGFNKYNESGVLFFAMPESVQGAAKHMALSDEIRRDVGRIAAGAEPDSPADNRVANIISSLQYKKTMSDRTASFDDYYGTVVGKVGIETARANSSQQAQSDVVGQISKIRESISGVSLDEETTKMIEFQKTFDASARLIRTADEMMDTVLNLKRL